MTADRVDVVGTVIGIDLGTLNSCVAAVRGSKAVILTEDQRTTIPSCVAWHGDKELVGAAARRHAVAEPQNTVIGVKRLLGHAWNAPEVQNALQRVAHPMKACPKGSVLLEVAGHELTPVQVSTRILARVKEWAENALGEPVSKAVISVPAHFNDVQRKATKLAAERAGLDVLCLINEPTAAAFAYGYKKGEDFTLAVYDLGGGTFDITVMRARGDTFEVLATDGHSYLGGEDFDRSLALWLEEEFERAHGSGLGEDAAARRRLCEAAEKAKVDLAEVEVARIEIPYLTEIDGAQVDFAAELTRAKANELVQPLIEKTLELSKRCVAQSGTAMEEIDDVLLVGGQSRMNAVRDAVAELFGRDPRRDINPDEVVAMGAALYGYSLVADDLRERAEDAAADAYAVALRGTDVARKLLDGIEDIESHSHNDDTLANLLKELIDSTAEEESDEMLPAAVQVARSEHQLPSAVEHLREELLELDYKKQTIEPTKAEASAPELIEAAVERINLAIEAAKSASEQASEKLEQAQEHASARKVNLLDVTSLPLGIAAAGNLFSVLIAQNTRVPTQAQRIFTTNQDGQSEVEIRVFQGRSKSAEDNQPLGSFILEGIPPAPRMQPKIEVTFRIDDNGILAVRASDPASGRQHGMRVDDPLGLQQSEITDDPEPVDVAPSEAAEAETVAANPLDMSRPIGDSLSESLVNSLADSLDEEDDDDSTHRAGPTEFEFND